MRRLLWRSAADRDLDEELRGYLEAATEAHRAAGLSPEDAARAARVEMGSLAAVKDQLRAGRWESIVHGIGRDVRQAVRMLRRTPAFTLAALAVLALSIGANTATFSIVNALLIRPLPVSAPDELVFISKARFNAPMCCTAEEAVYYNHSPEIFTGAASYRGDEALFGAGPDLRRVPGEAVYTNYFDVLGIRPHVGRGFVPADDDPAAAPVVIISDRLWRTVFQADREVLGKTIRLRSPGRGDTSWRYAVIGVMDASFAGLQDPWRPTEFWVPASQRSREADSRSASPAGTVVARRHPTVSTEQVRAFVTATHASFPEQAIYANPSDGLLIVRDSRRITLPLDSAGRVTPERLAAALMALGGLVLLVGVVNLAAVALTRGILRRPELALRLTLGATRLRIARQLACEGLLLSMTAGVGALLVARWGVVVFLRTLPARSFTAQYASLDVPLDMRVLLFASCVVLVAGLTVGLVPLLQVRGANLLSAMGHASDISPRRVRARLRHWVVIPQISLSVGLLLAALVAVRALSAIASIEPGYEPERAAWVQWRETRSVAGTGLSPEERQALWDLEEKRELLFRARVLELATNSPGITAAGLTDQLPIEGAVAKISAREGDSTGSLQLPVSVADVTPGYFEAAGIPLLLGRVFDPHDVDDGPGVVVISQSVADRLFPKQSPVGQYVSWVHASAFRNGPLRLQVIGVAGDVRLPYSEGEPQPAIYLSLARVRPLFTQIHLVARGDLDDAVLLRILRSAIWQTDPETEITHSQMMSTLIGNLRYPRRLSVGLLMSSALVALLLAGIGLYAIVSHSVAQRLRELAIRSALGAGRIDIMRLIIREGIMVAGIGGAIGLALAFIGMSTVSHQVFAIPPLDATTAVVVIAVVALVVLLASALPARRAARVDPMSVLRGL
jgi:predicted permease